MWKRIWRVWTVDKPAALGGWLWQILVVELAAVLDRLTLRKLIALIPVVILIGAYWHRIPLPPELMLVGDLLAYIDIFSMIFLVGLFTRVATVMAVVRQAIDVVGSVLRRVHRFGIRHRRAKGGLRRRRLTRAETDDDDAAVIAGLAWLNPGRPDCADASWRDLSEPAGIDETRDPSGNSRRRIPMRRPHRRPRRPNRVSSSASTRPPLCRIDRRLLRRHDCRARLTHSGRACRFAPRASAAVTQR
ncbi:hypothetical protein [Bradyrhizobium sp. USDA 4454]